MSKYLIDVPGGEEEIPGKKPHGMYFAHSWGELKEPLFEKKINKTSFRDFRDFPLPRLLFFREHPEAREGEVCIKNIREWEFGRISWTTKRMGSQNTDGSYPLFVQRRELESSEYLVIDEDALSSVRIREDFGGLRNNFRRAQSDHS